MTDKKTEADQTLRRRTEQKLTAGAAADQKAVALEEAQLLHELQVHQIELEMQNEELRANYFDLYDLAPAGYLTISDKGLILEANLTVTTLLGVTRSALVRQPFSRFIVTEDTDLFYLHRKTLLATGTRQDWEMRLLHPDGSFFWAYLQSSLVQKGDGPPTCHVVLVDITKRKQTEEHLKIRNRISTVFLMAPSRETYHEVLDILLETTGSTHGLFGYIDNHGSLVVPAVTGELWDEYKVADPKIVFPRMNWGDSSWPRAIREKKSNCSNKPSDTVPPGHLPVYRHIAVPLICEGKVVGLFLVANRAADYTGEDIEFLESIAKLVAPILDARLRLDESRRESQLLLTGIEQADEMIVITDAEGTIEYVNPAFEHTTGYAKLESIGQNPRLLKSGRHDNTLYAKLWKTISGGKTFQTELINKRKDGTLFNVDLTISPVVDASGAVTNYVSVMRDITEKMALEHTQQQAQKLEALGTMAGGIAHDFNNILTAILGYANLVREEIEEKSEAADDLQQVILAAERAVELVKQILLISRQTVKERQAVEIQPIIKEALKFLRPSISTSIEIKSVIEPECPAILADVSEMHQVIMNLCTNAYTAMSDVARKDHLLEIRLAPVTLDRTSMMKLAQPFPPGRFVKLTVSDTGCGMDAATIEKIFLPYFTTRKKGKGTGLGLAMVHSIVTGAGGFITVDSTVGKGSTFCAYLPVYKGAQETMTERKDPVITGGTERILVVDDEEPIIDLLQRTLTKIGYSVTAFSDCEAAVRSFMEQPSAFDLVITDMNMPKVMGVDLARAFLEARPELPIILCTGFSEAITAEKAKAMGIREFLYKPVDKDVLARTVRKVLDEKP